MQRRLSEYGLFFREFVRNQYTTGAILPSGPFLASALARFVRRRPNGPRRILEVGPGTGAVTRQIIAALRPNDRFDLVELNEQFVRCLRGRFQTDPDFRPAARRATILHCSVEDLPPGEPYDVIVSGLPLNNFPAVDVERILATLIRLLAPDATLSLFQYIGVRPAQALIRGRNDRDRLKQIGQIMGTVFRRHEIRRDWIWPNVPPAWVHHLRP